MIAIDYLLKFSFPLLSLLSFVRPETNLKSKVFFKNKFNLIRWIKNCVLFFQLFIKLRNCQKKVGLTLQDYDNNKFKHELPGNLKFVMKELVFLMSMVHSICKKSIDTNFNHIFKFHQQLKVSIIKVKVSWLFFFIIFIFFVSTSEKEVKNKRKAQFDL